MAALKSVKKSQRHYRIVGVIASRPDLALAMRISHPPDLFELRLDHLFPIANELEKKMLKLRAPIIITARHPAEGGANNMPLQIRRDLLLRFLPHAQYVDIELRSARDLRTVLDRAGRSNLRRIISFHHLRSTPSLGSLRAKARAAKALNADVFKVATRTDTPVQLGRLLNLVSKTDFGISVSAMGIGKLGALSRLLLSQWGSTLIYTSLGQPRLEGQISLKQFRAFGID